MKLSKVLSLVLAIAMLLTMPSFAASYTDVAADANYAEAVTVLSALNVLTGYEDGTFKPDGKITRAEYSAIVCRVNGMGESAKNNQVGGIFTDVAADHWASGYIATAYQAGIINGMGDGTFAPEAEVTYEQAVKMLVAALGYEMKAQSMGGYPTGYMMIANQESITVGTVNAAGGASRATVARLTYNAMTVMMMDQTAWGSETKFEPIKTQSLLWTKMNAVKAEVKIQEVPVNKSVTNVGLTVYVEDLDAVARNNYYPNGYVAGTVFSNFANVKINGVDLTGLQGLKVTAIVDVSDDADPKLVCVVPKTGKNIEVVVDPKLVADSNASGYVEYYKTNDDDKATKIKLDASAIATYVNMDYVGNTYNDYLTYLPDDTNTQSTAAQVSASDVAYRFVDTDNDGDYDTLFIDREEVFVVGLINANANKITRETANGNAMHTLTSGASITLDPDDDSINWSIKDTEGNAMEIADIEIGDIVALKRSTLGSDTFFDITVSRETVEGSIVEYYSDAAKLDSTATITKYTIGDASYELLGTPSDVPNPGDSIVAQVYNGKIISFSVAEGVRNYGLVIANNIASDFSTTYQVQVMTQKGEIVTFNLAEKVNGSDYNGTNFATEFPKGAIIAYELNSSDEIKKVDVYNPSATLVTGSNPAQYTYSVATVMNGGVLGNNLDVKVDEKQYNATSEKIGSYVATEASAVITVQPELVNASSASVGLTKTNVFLSSTDILEDDENYEFVLIHNDAKEIQFAVLYDAANTINYNNYPIMITKKATVTVDGDSRTKFVGYVNGEETEITVAEDIDGDVASLDVYDVAMFAVNGAGEMNNARILADYNSKKFTVVENYYTGIDDDNTAAIAAVKTILDGNAGVTLANQVDRTTAGAAANLKGLAYAGKAYKAAGGSLQIINDYAASEKATDGTTPITAGNPKNYDGTGSTDSLIEDLSINANAVAYYFNAKNPKVKLASIGDLETDVTVGADKSFNSDNDDMVYIYNYDGNTKLILIIDVAGNNGL